MYNKKNPFIILASSGANVLHKLLTTNCDYIYTRIIKIIFNKNERRCRDVKTQKASKQGWEANLGPKIKQTTSI